MWNFSGSNTDCLTFLIGGLNVWAYDWHPVKTERPAVKDPLYQQTHIFDIYTVADGSKTVEFAAGEFSNGVWGFYIRSTEQE